MHVFFILSGKGEVQWTLHADYIISVNGKNKSAKKF